MDEADYLCGKVGIIDKGRILVMDSTLELKNSIGNDVITLSCNDIKTLKKNLDKESWIKNIKQHDSFLTLGVKKGEEKIPVIIEIAQKLNIKIKSINVRKPTLDDVFLSFTGRTMRDQEPENPLRNMARMHHGRR
jgi:ABC-2 type transport system ATP-binding protein